MGRVKLFYTVDEDAVLAESAKIINLGADNMKHAVDLFTQVQEVLRGAGSEGGPANSPRALEMIEEFREALLNVDTRLEEVTAIIEGYEVYKKGDRSLRQSAPGTNAPRSFTERDDTE
tara:strand:- start:217 stop:570 length:354 start_codon:yes stop_codon:yes gene_type:complete